MGTALSTISGLNVSAYMTDSIKPPQAMIDFHPDYDLVFGGSKDTYNYVVSIYTQRDNEQSSQKLLDTYRDPNDTSSVKYVLENNATLAAAVDYAWVRRCSPVEVVLVGTVEYLRVNFDVEVVA